MKVLITGGCGFLGTNLSLFFLEKGMQVIVIDSLSREGSESNLSWLLNKGFGENLVFYKKDVSIQLEIENIFKSHKPFDYVIHVAGQVAMSNSISDPRNDFLINTVGTFNILEAVRKYSPEALLAYSSTNKVYGDLEYLQYSENSSRYLLKDYPYGLDESIKLDFSTPYGCSKGAADQYVRDWGRVYGLKTVVFRHSSIYGGRQFASIDQGWIGWFCKKACEQKIEKKLFRKISKFTISGTGKQVRDVLHAEDLINLYWLAYLKRDKLNGEIFNIGGGFENSLSLLELFDELCDQLDLDKLIYKKIERRVSDQDCFIASIEKAKRILDWSPKVSYKEGINKMLYWTESLSN